MQTTKQYITTAETAKHVREALKRNFPGTKFSVRSKTYAGGASIDVGWEAGPRTKTVEAVAKRFEGATFDGMQDLKEYHSDTWWMPRVWPGRSTGARTSCSAAGR